MAKVNCTRQFHSELVKINDALKAIFRLAAEREHDDVIEAAQPTMDLFDQLLVEADAIIPVDVQVGQQHN